MSYQSYDLYENLLKPYRVYEYIQYETVVLNGIEMNLHFHPHFT